MKKSELFYKSPEAECLVPLCLQGVLCVSETGSNEDLVEVPFTF